VLKKVTQKPTGLFNRSRNMGEIGMKMHRKASVALAILLAIVFLLSFPAQSFAHETDTAEHLKKIERQGVTVVVDEKYNLMWEVKSTDPASPQYKDRLFTWQQALDYADYLNSIAYAGETDWRVPLAMEMSTLVDVGVGSPCIDTAMFPENGNKFYWTSSEYPPLPSVVQYTCFVSGNQFKWFKNGFMRVRCVSGGGWTALYPGNQSDFTVVNNGHDQTTVIDGLTGLEWEQKSWSGAEEATEGDANRELQNLSAIIATFPYSGTWSLYHEITASGFSYDQNQPSFNLFWSTLGLLGDLGTLMQYFGQANLKQAAGMLANGAGLGKRSFLTTFTYKNAIAYVQWLNDIDFAGHTDWRLPTVEENITIADWNRVPCIKEVFTPSNTWLFWTQTECPFEGRHYFT
jgi:hypothetical protein